MGKISAKTSNCLNMDWFVILESMNRESSYVIPARGFIYSLGSFPQFSMKSPHWLIHPFLKRK